jgi:uncharacterized protein YbbC (DUF1343 family)
MLNIKKCSFIVFVAMMFVASSAFGQKWFDFSKPQPTVGASQMDVLLPKIKGKSVAMVVNHTAMVGKTHLTDTLKALGVDIKKVFGPEHGFRGAAADGETIKDGVDAKSGLKVVSLYGENKKPTREQLTDVDIVIFDIQDVGARFYTYISTLNYVMEACAEQKKTLLILDRPNPNGNMVDGPVLTDSTLRSFVGMNPIPIAHGMTVGEYATMLNGEGWLKNGLKCNLEIVKVKGWAHHDSFSFSPRPSPNLPNDQAVRLYPTTCLFEGTVISVGRGTQTPFLVLGNPLLKGLPIQFTPVSIAGMSTNPPHMNKLCYGIDLSTVKAEPKINIQLFIDFYNLYPEKEKFFTNYFDKLAGTKELKQQIKNGMSEEQIRKTWEKDLNAFKEKRKKYLLYP